MFDIAEVHFRVFYLLVAISVLGLLQKPLRNRKQPGSTWFAIAVGSISVWLACVGLYYFADELWTALALYNIVLFAITICFFSWLLMAIEFATGKRPPQWAIIVLGVLAVGHFVLLWTNYVWLHELVYRASGTHVDMGGGLNTGREPVFWIQMVVVYVIIFASSVVFTAEWLNARGPRKRQAGILAITPAAGVVTSVLWFAEVLQLPFDPTPVGVTVSIMLVGWALYRTDYLEITPIATRMVVEEMPDAVVIFDRGGQVIEWNRAAQSLFGVEDPSIGMPAASFFGSVSSDVRSRLLPDNQTNLQITIQGDERPRQFSVSKFAIVAGKTSFGRVVVLRDITELKRREEQLLAQNERLEEFTDIVSHDLQSPLMQIRSSAQEASSTGDVTHVDRVIGATDRIDELVTNLLKLARTGRQLDTEESVNLDEVAETAWSHVWSPSGELVTETNRTAVGDPSRIQQLFENMFRNAVEHSPPDGDAQTVRNPVDQRDSVRTETGSIGLNRADMSKRNTTSGDHTADATVKETHRKEFEDSESAIRETMNDADHSSTRSVPQGSDPDSGKSAADIKITVGPLRDGFYIQDDGAGIPPEQHDQIFEKGYTNASSGTGIGLSIVRQIVDAHGWSIRVTGGTDGGARFEITGVECQPIAGGERD